MNPSQVGQLFFLLLVMCSTLWKSLSTVSPSFLVIIGHISDAHLDTLNKPRNVNLNHLQCLCLCYCWISSASNHICLLSSCFMSSTVAVCLAGTGFFFPERMFGMVMNVIYDAFPTSNTVLVTLTKGCYNSSDSFLRQSCSYKNM